MQSHLPPCLILAALLIAPVKNLASDPAPRIYADGQVPDDKRLGPLKDLDGYFPFEPSKTREEWAHRAGAVRDQIRVSVGLWPMPSKTPLNAVIHGKIDRPDYTVEKVYFESVPGFFVTGSLYRPKGKSGKVPGVLCPHGHWDQGRFYDQGVEGTRKEIVQGAERFENGGRSPLQSRCVQIARMGCVAFMYDMIGYADSQQISDIAHRFAKQRPEMNSVENWGLFSPAAEEHLQSVMGLQTLNSVRALDFLLGLDEVDSNRIAVSGASGGGTQTFLLCAIDPRPAVAFPAVMVSTAMQGGCTCENASLLRIDTGNVEFAALFAPKPLGMTAANDWTHEMPSKGYPELRQHFQMMGVPNNVNLTPLLHFGHNYNYVSRAALYTWLNKHLQLGLKEPVVEEDYPRLSREELTVWDAQHPQPEGGPEFEKKLLRWLNDDAEKQLKARQSNLGEYREFAQVPMNVILGRNMANAGKVEWELKDKHDRGNYIEMSGKLRNTTYYEELPVIFLYPKEWKGHTVVWTDENGKAGLYEPSGKVKQAVANLVDAGATVLGVDLFEQGEFRSNGEPLTQTRKVKNEREFAGFTFGYNRPLFAQRVNDLLTVVSYVRQAERKTEQLDIVGLKGVGPIVAAARAQVGMAVNRAVIDTGGFRFGKVADLRDVNFLPGGAKYGDLPGMLALGAPGALFLAGEGQEAPMLVQQMYRSANAEKNMKTFENKGEGTESNIVKWLTAQETR